MLNAEQRQPLIAAIRALPSQLEALVTGLTDEQLHTHFIAHEWTVAQNVHHVFDSHANAYIRTKQLLTKNHPTVVPYDQDAWALLPDMTTTPIKISLDLLHALHTRWANLFDNLTDEQYARTGIHPDSGEISVSTILKSYVDHGEAHLDQIRRTLAAQPE